MLARRAAMYTVKTTAVRIHRISAMSGIPSSQGASEAARGFPRDYSRPAGDRSSKASPSAAAGAAAAGSGGGGSPSHLVVLGEEKMIANTVRTE